MMLHAEAGNTPSLPSSRWIGQLTMIARLGSSSPVALVGGDFQVIGDDRKVFARLFEERAGVDVHARLSRNCSVPPWFARACYL